MRVRCGAGGGLTCGGWGVEWGAMAERTLLEKRVIKAGIRLCKERVSRSGSVITANDLLQMRVRTFSPGVQAFYIVIGVLFIVAGVWIHVALRNMAISFTPVLIGMANIAYGQWGKPRKVGELLGEKQIMDISADIVREFVAEMDAKRGEKKLPADRADDRR